MQALRVGQAPPEANYLVLDRGEVYAPSRWLIYRDGVYRLDAADARGALDALLVELDDAVIAANVQSALVVHAGAVEVGGRAAVLPAASGSGKTTLTAACVAAGAGYLTDEAVIIDRQTLQVRPYQRPLCVKAGSRRVFAELTGVPVPSDLAGTWHVPPSQLGSLSAGGVPAAVALPLYEADVGLVVEDVSRAEAVLALAGQASFLEQQGPQMLEVLARIVRQSTCVRIRYDDARVAAQAVLELLA